MTPTHRCLLGGTPQARTRYTLDALARFQAEGGGLAETCWILVENRSEADAWHDALDAESSPVQGVKVMTWFQWSQHWLTQTFALAPVFMPFLVQELGVKDLGVKDLGVHAPSTTESHAWASQRQGWQGLSQEDVQLLLDTYLRRLPDLANDPQYPQWLKRLTHALLHSPHQEAWLTQWHAFNAQNPQNPLPTESAKAFEWFVQISVTQGMLPYSWMTTAGLHLLHYLKAHEAEALRHLMQSVRLAVVADATRLTPQTTAWLPALESNDSTLWILGDDFTFHTPLASNIAETATILPRPPFWDALKETLTRPLHLTYLPDETEEASPQRLSFKSYMQKAWTGESLLLASSLREEEQAYPLSLRERVGVRDTVQIITDEEGDSSDEAHRRAVMSQVVAWLEASEEAVAIVVPSVAEKRLYHALVEQLLHDVGEANLLLDALNAFTDLLVLTLEAPFPPLSAEDLHFNVRMQASWQLNPVWWVQYPEASEGMSTVLNRWWELSQPHRMFERDDFKAWAIALIENIRQMQHQMQDDKAFFEVLQKSLHAFSSFIRTPADEALWVRLERRQRQTQEQLLALLGNNLSQMPNASWGAWWREVLASQAEESSTVLAFWRKRLAVYTIEEAPAQALQRVIIPNLFATERHPKGLDALRADHYEESREAEHSNLSQNDDTASMLTSLHETLEALADLEKWVHQLSGATQVRWILDAQRLQGYSEAQRQVFHRFFDALSRQNSDKSTETKNVDLEDDPLESQATLADRIHALHETLQAETDHYATYGQFNQTPLSPSDISTYLKCPRQLFYNRLKLQTPFNPNASYGTLLHKLFELFHKACNAKQLDFTAKALKAFIRQSLDDASPSTWHPPDGLVKETAFAVYCQQPVMIRQSWLRNFLESIDSLEEQGFFKRVPQQVETEYRLNDAYLPDLSGFSWKMSIDAIFHYQDAIRLVDYKTSRASLTQSKAETREAKLNKVLDGLPPREPGVSGYAADVTDELNWQLPLYIVAYEHQNPQKPPVNEAGLQMCRSTDRVKNGSVFVSLDVARFRETQAAWLENVRQEVLEPLWQERTFVANPQGGHCEWCPYTPICEAVVFSEN